MSRCTATCSPSKERPSSNGPIWKIYLETKSMNLPSSAPPASTLIPVATLALESLEFEIDAIVVTAEK